MFCAFSYEAVSKTLEAVYRRAEQQFHILQSLACLALHSDSNIIWGPQLHLCISTYCLKDTEMSMTFYYFYSDIYNSFIKSMACTRCFLVINVFCFFSLSFY